MSDNRRTTENAFTKTLKTPSPPVKLKMFLESFDNNFNCAKVSTVNGSQNENSGQVNHLATSQQDNVNKVSHNLQSQFNQISQQASDSNRASFNQPYVPSQYIANSIASTATACTTTVTSSTTANSTFTTSSSSEKNDIQNGRTSAGALHATGDHSSLRGSALKTDDYKTVSKMPRSNESQSKASYTCRSRMGNTGEAMTGIVKKYRELQAKSKVSLVLDDSSTDEEESLRHTDDLSDTPSFKCSSDDEEFSSSQCTNSVESTNKSDARSTMNKNMRPYKSESHLSSFEDSGDHSSNGARCEGNSRGGMHQDSLRYHSQNALRKTSSAKVFETITVCNVDYFILNVIGEGGSSKVYQVCGCQNKEFYALKVVDMAKMADSLKKSLKKEIEILNMLKGCTRVIQLYAYEWNREAEKLMLVMEKGDSDLNTVLSKQMQNQSKRKGLDLHTIKHYWNEMLQAVAEIHKKEIVHSDLKPVNFVIVKGYLKIIDFGIADAINPDHTSVVKTNLIGTINFMSPESLRSSSSSMASGKKEIKVKCKSDVWSLGCILYNMCYGRTPFGHIDQIYEKMHAICNPKYLINYPPYENMDAVDCMKRCLDRDINSRPSVEDLLKHPFLNREKLSRLQTPTTRLPTTNALTSRNPLLEKRIFDDIGSEVNKLTPRSYNKFRDAMKKELTKFKK